jgi:hypothetical protein
MLVEGWTTEQPARATARPSMSGSRRHFIIQNDNGIRTRVMVAPRFRQRIRVLQDWVASKNRPRLRHAAERDCLKAD